jgi:TetR/AcrR family transcriptional regulator, cholesterol catabolism regulator
MTVAARLHHIPAVAPARRGRPPKTAEQRDDGNRRRELVRAAARLFRQHGFDATTTRDIAAAVGMQSGSPFYHFGSKQALLVAVMEDGMRSALATLVETMAVSEARGDSAVAALKTLVRAHLDVLLGPQSDFIPVMLQEWRVLTPEQTLVIRALKDDYEAHWTPVLAALHAQGVLRWDVALARMLLFGALNWSIKWYDVQERLSLDGLTDEVMLLLVPAAFPGL